MVTLGGDHSVTLPILRAHAKVHGPLALIQFDAHTDSWPDDDASRVDHGTFVYKAVKEGLIDPARSVQIGIRTTNDDPLGIEVIDVRIKRADLPRQNLDATFERMKAERQREAADEIARGNEAAQKVRAQADRTVVETTSEARKTAEIVRGEADARRNAIFAEAYGQDPEFFAFYRSLRAYEEALKGENSTLVINPDSEFFTYLKADKPE